MNKMDSDKKVNQAQRLRRQAEEALRGNPVDLKGLHPDDIQHLLHELQVHQTELTIQNEELRRVQLDLEISRDLFSKLYNYAPVGYCTLSQKGRILNANQTLGDMLGIEPEKLIHRMFSEYVSSDSQDDYYRHCQRALQHPDRVVSQIQLVKPDEERLVVRMESASDRADSTQLMVMVSDITEQLRLEALQQENVLRIALQRRLLEQSEKERVELARNLHDGPIQRLSGFGFSIQMMKDILEEHGVDEDGIAVQMGEDIKELIAELRGMCNDLRPPVLAKLGLRRAITENVEDLQQKYPGTKITLDLHNDPTRLPDHIALALYRIYQQAMNNIYHHAKASQIWIRLTLDAQWIRFEVEDNGQGISGRMDWSEYARQGHYGLVGMKERAEAFGGTFQLTSAPGEGTTVQVSVPLAVTDP